MAHSTVTLTGKFSQLDGTAGEGTATIVPSRRQIVDGDGHVVLTGRVSAPLDVDGRLAVDVPATDDPRLGEPFTYTVSVAMNHAVWSVSGLTLPAAAGTVDLSQAPAEQVTEYLRREEVQQLIDGALQDVSALTVSTTAPERGLWVDPNVEA